MYEGPSLPHTKYLIKPWKCTSLFMQSYKRRHSPKQSLPNWTNTFKKHFQWNSIQIYSNYQTTKWTLVFKVSLKTWFLTLFCFLFWNFFWPKYLVLGRRSGKKLWIYSHNCHCLSHLSWRRIILKRRNREIEYHMSYINIALGTTNPTVEFIS